MHSFNIKFSILIGFRNREIDRVSRCIESFAQQSIQNFELIFIDYGSDLDVADAVQQLLSNYSFVKYIYTDTRGWFWNRAHALNTGLVNSKGKYIISSDIDMIHAPNFIEQLDKIVEPDVLYHYRCYYLPENYKYDHRNLNGKAQADYPVSSKNARGLLVIDKATCLRIDGWNEKFKIYGGEDNDISQKLLNAGLQLQWLPINKFTTYHQWHPTHKKNIEVLPYKWKKKIMDYLVPTNHKNTDTLTSIGKIYTTQERYSFIIDNKHCIQYELDDHFGEQIFSFLEKFSAVEPGTPFKLYCHYSSAFYKFQKQRETPSIFIKAINFILKKCKISTGLQLTYLPDSRSLDIFHMRDTTFYLLEYLMAIDYVKDYQFTFEPEKLELIIIRQ